MTRTSRLLVPAALGAALTAGVLTAGPAAAKGGDPAPAPAPESGSYCTGDWVEALPDGSTVFANEASGGGCVYVRSYLAGYLRLDHVVLAPGWSYVVQKNGEGTSSRVELQFTQAATGRKVDFRVEYGKTKFG
jgi:hypothetical protein